MIRDKHYCDVKLAGNECIEPLLLDILRHENSIKPHAYFFVHFIFKFSLFMLSIKFIIHCMVICERELTAAEAVEEKSEK